MLSTSFTSAKAFWAQLKPSARQHLMSRAGAAMQPPPANWRAWHCGDLRLGPLSKERADWLLAHLPHCVETPSGLRWDAASWSQEQRSESLQQTLCVARSQGLMQGWRDERFSFWRSDVRVPELQHAPLLEVERSGFRFLGLVSHAVHVNGFHSSGALWCGRRAPTKATDPGMLDNVTAGGVGCGESLRNCLLRELAEEAGLRDVQRHVLRNAGSVRTARLEREGWHDEILHIFNISLSDDFVPVNQDNEVSEFLLIEPSEVLERIDAGEFTKDAVQALVQGLQKIARSC